LRDISFRVEAGDSFAIIGPNGAGKTTTLRLLSGITKPTSGQVLTSGRMSSLIELGAGFHPELTGRENIYLNGAILGLSRRDIQHKLDDIIAFSELERFIDTPVKRYSSGMYVRLGFSVAAHVEPEILVVDEVLAVGDASFRQRCMTRMEGLRAAGTTLIFVSHNMHQVRRLCRSSLLLANGVARCVGSTEEALAAYEAMTYRIQDLQKEELSDGQHGSVFISGLSVLNGEKHPATEFAYRDALYIRIKYRLSDPPQSPIIKVRLIRADGMVCSLASTNHHVAVSGVPEKQGDILALFEPVQLVSGRYVAEVRFADSSDEVLLASGVSDEFVVVGESLMHEPDQGVYVPSVRWFLGER
jgi:lipopolysaccharide transport system ATP-binding protein